MRPKETRRNSLYNSGVMRKIPLLGLVILIVSAAVLSGCRGTSLNLPNAKDLCLSVWSDLYKLNYWLDEEPIPHDEFSQEYDPYPKYASSDYETRYRRVFVTWRPIEIRKTHLKLAPLDCLTNDVRVYRSVEKAKEGFADMSPPRFGFSDLRETGITGTEWDIASVGDESKAWYYAEEVLDEDREMMVKQIEAEMYFRKGYVISSVGVKTWGDNFEEAAAFLHDVARVSEAKISKSIALE